MARDKACGGHLAHVRPRVASRRSGITAYRVIGNYGPNAGCGSNALSASDTWRNVLLGSVAAGALFFGYGRSARANCSGPAPTLTCTGDISGTAPPGVYNGGIRVPPAPVYTTLDVNNITSDITPDSGVDGINFVTNGDITINSDTGPFAIITTGYGADGMYARSETGTIRIESTGDIVTRNGIFAYAYSANSLSIITSGDIQATDSGIIALSLGGMVTVHSTGDINARYGIYARSTGAAGGVSITSVGDIEAVGAVGDGIRVVSPGAGPLTIDSTGDITSSFGHGIIAYKVSSTGVSVKSTGTIQAGLEGIFVFSAGRFDIESTGDITSTTSDAVFAAGYAAGSTVTLRGGTVFGASDGVEFLGAGGLLNTLDNYAALSGGVLAVRGGLGDDIVNNYNLITGSVDLGAGSNAFNNRAGGTFRSGAIVNLGAGNTLTNAGTLSPFGAGAIGTTLLTGNLVQDPGGILSVDVDMNANLADSIDMNASGTASLSGNVALNFFNLSPVPRSFTIIDDATAIPVQGLGVLNPAVISQITYPGGTDVVLTITGYDFSASGLNQNQTNIGDNLNAIFAAGSGGMPSVLLGLANLTSLSGLAGALDQLSPEVYNYTKIDTLFAAEQFSSDMMSCRVADGSGASFIHEGQCVWARARARFLDIDTTPSNIGSDSTIGSFSGGAQVALAPDWRLGFAAGYDQIALDTGSAATADGERANIGASIKYNPGRLLLSAAAARGWATYDTTRAMAFGGFAGTATGDSDVDYVSGRLHAAYLFDYGHWYLKPLVDATLTEIDFGGTAETGTVAALNVAGDSDTIFSIAPALEIGSEYRFGEFSVLRPFVRAGVTWRDADSMDLSAAFAAAPAGVGPFVVGTALDEVLVDVSAGFDVINTEGAVLRLQYDGRFGEETRQNSASIKGSVPF